jgi:hypothetical protein
MDSLPALRLTVALNAMINTPLSVPEAVAVVQGVDVVHHIVDPDDRLGLDQDGAVALVDALPLIAARESEMWVLALPEPGAAGALRGPAALTADALGVGEAVVAGSAGMALVPHRVGPAVQWRVWPAERPAPPPSPPEADGALSETVIAAADALGRLAVAAGSRPSGPVRLATAPGLSTRQQARIDRALRLLEACTLALESDGASISSWEAEARFRELRRVRAAAAATLCATATWAGHP